MWQCYHIIKWIVRLFLVIEIRIYVSSKRLMNFLCVYAPANDKNIAQHYILTSNFYLLSSILSSIFYILFSR